tara:strand:+ start:383 stop:592 length:210 start_codon:yes stop_codon:yes gene_type:complete
MSNVQTNIFGVEVQLSGTDGNAFMLMGRCSKAARQAGIEKSKIDEFTNEAMQGDYDHLLRTCMKYFDVN